MSDLARSLVDAAASRMAIVMLEKCPPNIAPTLPPGCTARDLAAAAALAVVEALDAEAMKRVLNYRDPIDLREVAGEIQEARDE